MLDLDRNKINAAGAQHLANALALNRVNLIFNISISYTFVFHSDNYHTQSST